MPQAEEEAQSIVDTEEEISPEENFTDAFDDPEEAEEKVTEGEADEGEEVTSEVKDDDDEVTDDDDEEVTEELSALELAEKQASEKFLKKDEKTDDETKTDDDKTEDKVEEKIEIDFTDVDSDPVKFVEGLVDKVEDVAKKARLKETLSAYPEIGELAAMISRDLVGRQTVKMAEGTQAEIPEEYKTRFDTVDGMKTELDNLRAEMSERQYFDAIEKEVPGARAIADTEKFIGWLGKQSVGINTLANSGDSADAVAVLKAYKEHEARAAAKNIDEKGGKRKKKADSSMKKVVKSTPTRTTEDAKDDFNAGFDA